MSLLTLDVGGPDEMTLTVLSRSGHAEPRPTGSRRYRFFGREFSTIRFEAMVVPVVLDALSVANALTVRTLFADGAQVVCSGDVFNNGGAEITCSAEITDELIPGLVIANDPWVLNLTLYEVDTSEVLG